MKKIFEKVYLTQHRNTAFKTLFRKRYLPVKQQLMIQFKINDT
jgi:hypothetical protein